MGKAFKDMEVVRAAALEMAAAASSAAPPAASSAIFTAAPTAAFASVGAGPALASATRKAEIDDPMVAAMPVVCAAEGTYRAALALGLGGEAKGAMAKVFEQRWEPPRATGEVEK